MTVAHGTALGIAAAALLAPLSILVVRKFAGVPSRRAAIVLAGAIVLACISAAMVMPTLVLTMATIALGWTLAVLAAVDFAIYRLPDVLTLPLTAAGLAVTGILPDHPIVSHSLAALLGFAAFAGLAWSFRRLRGHEALGMGDAKLAAAAGAWLGIADLPYTIVLACVGAFVWIGLRATAEGRQVLTEKIPFGPPLALAIWIVWLYGAPMPIAP